MSSLKISKAWKIISVLVILIAVLGISLLYGHYKEYLYEDEVLSYTLANHQNGGFFELTEKHYTGDDFLNYLIVDGNHRFDYGNVAYNQSLDAHPILYYDILHTISSIRVGTYSKWYGVGINIVCLLGTLIIVYFIATHLFKESDIVPLVAMAVYGISCAAMTMVCFIRMYALLTLLSSAYLLLHIIKLEIDGRGRGEYSPGHLDEKAEKKNNIIFYICLFVITVLGLLTHFYFMVFAFFVSAVFCIYKLFTKKFKELIIYVVTMMLSFGATFLIYPPYINTLLGYETSPIAKESDFVFGSITERIQKMIFHMNMELFDGRMKWVVLLLIVYAVYLIVSKKSSITKIIGQPVIVWMTIIAAGGYFAVITLVTPYLADRYVWPSFPYVMLIIAAVCVYIADDVFKSRIIAVAVVIAVFAMPVVKDVRAGLYDYNMNARLNVASDNHDVNCVFLSSLIGEENVFELSRYDDIYIADDVENIKPELLEDALVMYVPQGVEIEEYAKTLIQDGNYSNVERLYVASYADVYKFTK